MRWSVKILHQAHIVEEGWRYFEVEAVNHVTALAAVDASERNRANLERFGPVVESRAEALREVVQVLVSETCAGCGDDCDKGLEDKHGRPHCTDCYDSIMEDWHEGELCNS